MATDRVHLHRWDLQICYSHCYRPWSSHRECQLLVLFK